MDEPTQILDLQKTNKIRMADKEERARKKAEAKRRRLRRRRIQQAILLGFVLLIILGIVLIVRACTAGSASLAGTWDYEDEAQYTFSDDGTGYLTAGGEKYRFSYTDKDGTITIDFKDPSVHDCAYDYELTKTTLTLTGGTGTADPGTEYRLDRAD